MAKEREEQIYDLRILEHNIREGAIKQKDYQSYLHSLPNSESNADYIEVYEEPTTNSEQTKPEGMLTFQPAEPMAKPMAK